MWRNWHPDRSGQTSDLVPVLQKQEEPNLFKKNNADVA